MLKESSLCICAAATTNFRSWWDYSEFEIVRVASESGQVLIETILLSPSDRFGLTVFLEF